MNRQYPYCVTTRWSETVAAQRCANWRRLLGLGPVERHKANVTLFRQGDNPREVLLLTRGIVKLTCDLRAGQRSLVGLRYPGHFVEEFAHDLHLVYPVSGITIVPCELYRIDIVRLRALEQQNPEVSAFEKRIVKQDLYNCAHANLEKRTLEPADQLERFLWELATILGARGAAGQVRLALPLDNSEMAELLGFSESHYKHIRGQLERAGRLKREGRRNIALSAPSYVPAAD
jgi:CRP-like cAMP-binding protein